MFEKLPRIFATLMATGGAVLVIWPPAVGNWTHGASKVLGVVLVGLAIGIAVVWSLIVESSNYNKLMDAADQETIARFKEEKI